MSISTPCYTVLITVLYNKSQSQVILWEFPGGLVVGILGSHCRGPGFNPWSGNRDPASCVARPKRKKNKVIVELPTLFFTVVLATIGSLHFHRTFRISLSISLKNACWDFDWSCF